MKKTCTAALLLCASLASGQPSDRPKLGLALGGGAAKGFAHLGILQWLQENRIPVDYLAGTSMGGLVGGAYATGLSPEEVREVIHNVDWDLMFLGEAPYKDKEFRRKQDRRQLTSTIQVGLKQGFRLPSGIDPAHRIGLLLSWISFPYTQNLHFDDLPTPFRCVSTDMGSAEIVVLDHGSLAQSLLSTMAIPGVFPPVKIEGRTLADGGLLDNVPADVVRSMGADVVIAVDVGDYKLEGELDALGQAGQAINVMMAGATRLSLQDADFVIRPDLEGLGSMDWRRSEDLAELGYRAAEAAADELLPYAVNEDEWARHMQARESRILDRAYVPTFLEVRGTSPERQALVERRLAHNMDETLDFDALGEDLTWVTGSERYDRLRYEATYDDGQPGLLVIAREKSNGPPFLRFGLDIRNDALDLAFGFRTRLIALDVGKTGAEVRADASVGALFGAGVEYYWPFGGSRMFFAPRAFAYRENRNVFVDNNLVTTVRDRSAAVGGDFGFTTFRNTEFRLGYQTGDVESSIQIGDPQPEVSGRESLARLRLRFDGMDAPIIPTKGIRFEANADWFFDAPGAEGEFGTADASVSIFQPLSSKSRIFGTAGFGSTFEGEAPLFYQFRLGGPFRLSSFDRDQFRGQRYLRASAGYLRTIFRLPDFVGGPVYATAFGELGSAYDDIDDAVWHGSVSGGVVMDTLLGPLLVAMAFGDEGSSKFYFILGNIFR